MYCVGIVSHIQSDSSVLNSYGWPQIAAVASIVVGFSTLDGCLIGMAHISHQLVCSHDLLFFGAGQLWMVSFGSLCCVLHTSGPVLAVAIAAISASSVVVGYVTCCSIGFLLSCVSTVMWG